MIVFLSKNDLSKKTNKKETVKQNLLTVNLMTVIFFLAKKFRFYLNTGQNNESSFINYSAPNLKSTFLKFLIKRHFRRKYWLMDWWFLLWYNIRIFNSLYICFHLYILDMDYIQYSSTSCLLYSVQILTVFYLLIGVTRFVHIWAQNMKRYIALNLNISPECWLMLYTFITLLKQFFTHFALKDLVTLLLMHNDPPWKKCKTCIINTVI